MSAIYWLRNAVKSFKISIFSVNIKAKNMISNSNKVDKYYDTTKGKKEPVKAVEVNAVFKDVNSSDLAIKTKSEEEAQKAYLNELKLKDKTQYLIKLREIEYIKKMKQICLGMAEAERQRDARRS